MRFLGCLKKRIHIARQTVVANVLKTTDGFRLIFNDESPGFQQRNLLLFSSILLIEMHSVLKRVGHK